MSSPLLQHLAELRREQKDLSFSEIREKLSSESYALAVLIWTLPFLQPIPLPGLSTPLGGLIVTTQLMALAGKQLWIPSFLLSKKLTAAQIEKIYQWTLKLNAKMEMLEKSTRLIGWIQLPLFVDRGIMMACGMLLALPLPIPLTNSLPAWCILFLSLAEIEKLSWLKIAGYLVGLFTIFYFIFIFEGIQRIFFEMSERLHLPM